MRSSSLRQHYLARWAFSLSLALAAALIIHFVRIYPWHRVFLAESTTPLLEHLPVAPISQEGSCFRPRESTLASKSASFVTPIGSLDTAGLDDRKCFQYASRFEPFLAPAWNNSYLVKALKRLGLQDNVGIESDLIWYANLLAENEPHEYRYTNWSDPAVLHACPTHQDKSAPPTVANTTDKPRLAFVLRCYQNFVWSQDDILHLRALIWELRTADLPFNVDVHLLLEVKDASSYVSMFTESGRMQILRGSLPIEFWQLVTLWSEQEMLLRYPLYGDFRAEIQAAGSYRGCLLPVQRFAVDHPEYSHLINWELDSRFTHTYDKLIESLFNYAHKAGAQTYTQWSVHGLDPTTPSDTDAKCKDKTPDIVVFSPVRNPQNSDWYWEYDVQGYPAVQLAPRAASVGTNLWLSRRALLAMENITANQHKSLFCEAMAPSIAMQSASNYADPIPAGPNQCIEQLKLVHYPHPVAFKYQASPAKLEQLLNPTHAVLSKANEEALKDTSYYYTSTIAGRIYEKWRTEPQACIMPLLLHPIKGSRSASAASNSKQFLQSWFGGTNKPSLCASSDSDQCTATVVADIERFIGRKFDAGGQSSLFRWDLEQPRFVSRRNWIMNSSTRSLVYTIVVCLLLACMFHLIISRFILRGARRPLDEYIPLATD
ncbi:uncharacterized protein UTRI_00363_B [Ustilago trichophora]|uniref:Uncharacterized protein n=1 Tax=Ustilago trichophora TaxID=86804 RepID=A0A5C3DP07_9BASI|nr:uncharacterized protein UTRI_00363_B [Ustilago trichophora]